MFFYSPVLLALIVAAEVIVGGTLGALSGRLTAAVLSRNWRDLVRLRGILGNGCLGAAAFIGSLILIAVMPWPRNTIAYDLEGGTHVISTTNRYQYPLRVAFTAAIALPLLQEVYRARRYRRVNSAD